MYVKERCDFNVNAWIDFKLRADKLVVENEPVDYQLFDLMDNIWREVIIASFISLEVIAWKEDTDRVLPKLLKSEKKLLEHTEELEAMIKKTG